MFNFKILYNLQIKKMHFDEEYASQVMDTIPLGYVDKTICGCGITSVALENNENYLILVPSYKLGVNKSEQYPNDRSKFKVLNINGTSNKNQIEKYIKTNKILKVISTYDSTKKLANYLHLFDKIIMDESDMLLTVINQETRRKNIMDMLSILEKNTDKLSIVSATPIPLKYMPNWMSNLDQVKITWGNTIKATPILLKRTYPYKTLITEIITPIIKNKEVSIGNKTFSKCVIFINNITQIKRIIIETNIESCSAVICGESVENDSKLNGIKRYDSGEIPTFLFVTSSGFQGIDLYDSSAMSIVVSNISKKYTMVDINTDLKQAVSRVRTKSNPNYGSYIFIYNQTVFSKSKEELLKDIESDRKMIIEFLPLINKAIKNGDKYPKDEILEKYTFFDDNGFKVMNEDLFKADMYKLLEVREQYINGVEIKVSEENNKIIIEKPTEIIKEKTLTYSNYIDHYLEHKSWNEEHSNDKWKKIIESSISLFGKTWKNIQYAEKMINSSNDKLLQIKISIDRLLKINIRYENKVLKNLIQKVYDEFNLNRIAKASDILEIMGTENVKKYRSGYEITGKIKFNLK